MFNDGFGYEIIARLDNTLMRERELKAVLSQHGVESHIKCKDNGVIHLFVRIPKYPNFDLLELGDILKEAKIILIGGYHVKKVPFSDSEDINLYSFY